MPTEAEREAAKHSQDPMEANVAASSMKLASLEDKKAAEAAAKAKGKDKFLMEKIKTADAIKKENPDNLAVKHFLKMHQVCASLRLLLPPPLNS